MMEFEQFKPLEAQRGSDEERAAELKRFESLKFEVDKLLDLLKSKISEPGIGSGKEDTDRVMALRGELAELDESSGRFDSMPIDNIRALNTRLIKIRSIAVANLKSFDPIFANYPEG